MINPSQGRLAAVTVETDAESTPDPIEEHDDDQIGQQQDSSTPEPEVTGAEEDRVDDTTHDNDRQIRSRLPSLVAFILLPAITVAIASAAGYLKWEDASGRAADKARIESTLAAKDAAVAMLSYRPDTVDKDLGAARDRLTGNFKDSYSALTRDVVIPGAKQRNISAVAAVPAVSSVSASASHAVAMVFVNQTTIIGNDPPTDSTSVVRMTLQKVNGHWLVSQFDPI